MAILSGFTSGKSRKSVGEVTFTRLKGQNVAKAKVMRNPNQQINEFQYPTLCCLTYFGKFYKALRPLFELTYEPTKRGSVYNSVLKEWMPAMANSFFYKENANTKYDLDATRDIVPTNIYGFLSMDIPDELINYGGVNSTGSLAITGTSAAATIAFTYPDGTILEDSDALYAYFICGTGQDFFKYYSVRKRIMFDEAIQEDGGTLTSWEPIQLPAKCIIAVAAIKRNSKIMVSTPIMTVQLAS